MVPAGWPLFTENTLAARPVGAKSDNFCPMRKKVFTMALANDVLPVPAETRKIITQLSDLSARKLAKVFNACS